MYIVVCGSGVGDGVTTGLSYHDSPHASLVVPFLARSLSVVFLYVRYQDLRGIPLSPPTEIDALYGLLFASFYYLYLQVGPCAVSV